MNPGSRMAERRRAGEWLFLPIIPSIMDALTLIREFLDSRLEIAPETVLPESKLDDLSTDALPSAEIIIDCDARFNLTLHRNLKSPRTVGDLVALMDRLRSEQG